MVRLKTNLDKARIDQARVKIPKDCVLLLNHIVESDHYQKRNDDENDLEQHCHGRRS